MTAQGGSAWTVDMCGGDTRSRKAAGIEDRDRGGMLSAAGCRLPALVGALEKEGAPLMIKPLQPPCGRGKSIPLWWLRHHLCHGVKRVTGFSVAPGLPTNPVPLPPR